MQPIWPQVEAAIVTALEQRWPQTGAELEAATGYTIGTINATIRRMLTGQRLEVTGQKPNYGPGPAPKLYALPGQEALPPAPEAPTVAVTPTPPLVDALVEEQMHMAKTIGALANRGQRDMALKLASAWVEGDKVLKRLFAGGNNEQHD